MKAADDKEKPRVLDKTPGEVSQLKLDFGDRFDDLSFKSVDKATVKLLQACAELGLDSDKVGEIMQIVCKVNEDVKFHQKDPRLK